MNENITIPKAQLAELLKQNNEMKALINRGALVISQVVDITGLSGNSGNLMLKIPKILHNVQKKPQIIDELQAILTDFAKYLEP